MDDDVKSIEEASFLSLIKLLDGVKPLIKDSFAVFNQLEYNLGGKNNVLILEEFGFNAIHFIENRTPNFYPLFLAHSLREMVEKLYLNIELDENFEHIIDEDRGIDIPKICQVELSNKKKYPKVKSISNRKIVWCGFMSEKEQKELLLISDRLIWERMVWKIWSKAGKYESNISKLKLECLIKSIYRKFSKREEDIEILVAEVKQSYKILTKLAHFSPNNYLLIQALDKGERGEILSSLESQQIRVFISEITKALSFFNDFRKPTSQKIDEIDALING